MGYTLPATIGVCFAKGKEEVIGITGDGSFQMNIQELQTIVHHHLPIKIFVWNNDGYLSIRATQKKFFLGRYIGTEKSSGVSLPENLDAVLDEVFKYPGPAICEVICLRDQEIIPTVTSYQKEDGTIVSKPLEDMYPFLDRQEFLENMIVKPID
jgi:acetolactate synthase-1/2/3 large subunit